MLGERRRRWANNSSAFGERVMFDRLHTHRQRLMHRQHERSQVNQHVSTSLDGRHNNYANACELTIDATGILMVNPLNLTISC